MYELYVYSGIRANQKASVLIELLETYISNAVCINVETSSDICPPTLQQKDSDVIVAAPQSRPCEHSQAENNDAEVATENIHNINQVSQQHRLDTTPAPVRSKTTQKILRRSLYVPQELELVEIDEEALECTLVGEVKSFDAECCLFGEVRSLQTEAERVLQCDQNAKAGVHVPVR